MNQKHKLQHISNKKNTFKQHTRIKNTINSTKSIPRGGAFMLSGKVPKKQKLLLHKHRGGNGTNTTELEKEDKITTMTGPEVTEFIRESDPIKFAIIKKDIDREIDKIQKINGEVAPAQPPPPPPPPGATGAGAAEAATEPAAAEAAEAEAAAEAAAAEAEAAAAAAEAEAAEAEAPPPPVAPPPVAPPPAAQAAGAAAPPAGATPDTAQAAAHAAPTVLNQAIDNVLQRRGYKKLANGNFLLINNKPYNIYDLTITLQSKHNSWSKMKEIDATIKIMASLFHFEIQSDTNFKQKNKFNSDIIKYLNILIKLMEHTSSSHLDDDSNLDIGYDVASEILKKYCYKPLITESKNLANQQVTLTTYDGRSRNVDIDTANIEPNELIIVSGAIPPFEEKDNAELNQHENLNKLLSFFENKTEFKKFQRRLANASTMEELLEIKKNLGSGFEINNDLNEISYKYNREAFKPDEAAEDKAIHDLITQLQEKIKAKDTKHYFKEISAPLESAMDNYKKEKPAGNTK